ncbi:peptidylprolyl isomerase [Rurimicrobium arvi]|uniref:SurA N-terminal domain-containing protein n=1 Tax=Rurimicrobium arvi TaxID=2049916 RepID=A0ABP8MHJ9_9BACT
MAIIQKIRDKYAKLAGGVIAVSLIAFVVNDAFNSNSGSIFGSSKALAKVDGSSVDPLEFDKRVREYNTVFSISNQNREMTDEIRAQISEQALRDLVNEKIIDKQLSKLGITISDKEMKDVVYGTTPSNIIMNYPVFTNPETGGFDPSRIKAYEEQLANPPAQVDLNALEKEREQWENYKSFAMHQYKMQRFNGLVNASMYSPKFMVDYKMAAQNEMASIRVVKVPATTIPDSEVPLTDADINSYVEKHKKRFELKEDMRGIDYVAFDVVPSTEDTNTAAESLAKLKQDLTVKSGDQLKDFVNTNSEDAYRDFYFTKSSLKSVYADTLLSQPVGTVVGPYIDGKSFVIAKITDRREMPDSVKAQHVLIQPTQQMNDSAAHKMADSLMLAIQSGAANFDSVARQFSADKQNSDKGGDLGYFAYGQMVPEFNDFTFMGKTGEIKVVKTQFGYHIVRINDQKNLQNGTKIAFITKSLYPSDATETEIYSKATEFASKYKGAKFEEGVTATKMQKREADQVRVQDFSIGGLGPAREIVRWMYDAKQGDVSEVLKVTSPNTRYIIAKLTNIQSKGTLKVNDAVKPELENIVRMEKKMDKIVEKYKSQTSLEAVAQAAGQPVLAADSFTNTVPYLASVGYEPKVVGYSFYKNAKVGSISPAIKGQDGVSYMVITQRVPKQANPNEAAVFQQQQMMEQQQMQRTIGNNLQEMLMRKANVKYYNDNIR